LFRTLRSMLRRPSYTSRYEFASDADVTAELLEELEVLARWVADLLESDCSHARIQKITVTAPTVPEAGDQPDGRCVIGLCWTRDTQRGPEPRRVWIDSGLSLYDETKTAIHEFVHALCDEDEHHGLMFRQVYNVTWALYFNPAPWEISGEVRRVVGQYSGGTFWSRLKERYALHQLIRWARCEHETTQHPSLQKGHAWT